MAYMVQAAPQRLGVPMQASQYGGSSYAAAPGGYAVYGQAAPASARIPQPAARVPGMAAQVVLPPSAGAQARVIGGGAPQVMQRVASAAQPAGYVTPGGYAQVAAAAQPSQYISAMPAAAAVPQVASANVQQMQKLMENRKDLKSAVVKSFKRVAGSSRTIDINGLKQMRLELSGLLGIPEHVFGTIEDEYIRFDFDGTGFLEANEVYKLIKWHLHEYLHQLGGNAKGNIKFQSLQASGYTTTTELGAGNQASVKLAIDRYGNQRCIKCYNKGAMSNFGNLADLQDEFETMQLLACKNIARTFEIFQDQNFVYMVNEVYHGGDLTKLEENTIRKCGQQAITEDWWRGIFRQCFEALQFMHQQAMMHCDIKEPNMMLRTDNYANPQVVLIDFGVSKAMTAKDTGMCSGTPGYMPPETMNTGKWYPGGDIFSMGVAMVQLLTRKVPDDDKAKQGIMIGIFLEGCRSIEDVKNAVNSRPPPLQMIPPNMAGLQPLLARILDKNMRTRVKAPVILKDPWFGAGRVPQEAAAVEKAMMPIHPLATCGITEEMMAQPSVSVGPAAFEAAAARPVAASQLAAAYGAGGAVI